MIGRIGQGSTAGISKRLSRLHRRLRRPRPVILMYHRVAAVTADPWGLAVTPDHFRSQIAALRRSRTVLPMTEFVDRASRDALPRDAVAVTFDDGYLDNLTDAAPVLAQAGVPATLFLATAPMEHGGGYWWDALAAMVLDAAPATGEVRIAGQAVVIDLGPREADDDARQGWRAWAPRTAREHLHYALWQRIRPLDPALIVEAMASVQRVLGVPALPLPRAMRIDEVTRLIATAPFTLGGHSADHVDLAAHPAPATLAQIVAGRDAIRAVTAADPVGFAYPYGSDGGAARDMVRHAGFDWACTTRPGSVGPRTDRLALPRLTAQDVPHIEWLE